MAVHGDRELMLQAMLAEYETLQTELQNRFILLHVTALTIVFGLLLREWVGRQERVQQALSGF